MKIHLTLLKCLTNQIKLPAAPLSGTSATTPFCGISVSLQQAAGYSGEGE
jgi:hypothetical protein